MRVGLDSLDEGLSGCLPPLLCASLLFQAWLDFRAFALLSLNLFTLPQKSAQLSPSSLCPSHLLNEPSRPPYLKLQPLFPSPSHAVCEDKNLWLFISLIFSALSAPSGCTFWTCFVYQDLENA
jgi:hypothetical protein